MKSMAARVIDDVRVRMNKTRTLSLIGSRKKALARVLVANSSVAILLMSIAVELRLTDCGLDNINAVKLAGVVNTVVGVSIFLYYYFLHYRLITLARSSYSHIDLILFVLELLALLAGIMPPWTEGYISNPKLEGQFGHMELQVLYPTTEELHARIHIDCLGVLAFVRLPLMAKWVVASGILNSPAFLAWKFNVDVSPMFRLKYLFTRRPMQTLLWSTTLSWFSLAFTLHVFEHQFTPSFGTWFITSFDYLVGLGYGPLMPDTLVGRLAACSLTMVGVLAAAMITAMFADSFELDQSELWLITQIEKQHQDKQLKDAASQLVRARARFRSPCAALHS